jgi:hypothetical protein
MRIDRIGHHPATLEVDTAILPVRAITLAYIFILSSESL